MYVHTYRPETHSRVKYTNTLHKTILICRKTSKGKKLQGLTTNTIRRPPGERIKQTTFCLRLVIQKRKEFRFIRVKEGDRRRVAIYL